MTPSHRLASILLCLPLWLVCVRATDAQTGFGTEIQVLERLAEERYAEGDLLKAAELYREIAAKGNVPEDRARALFTASWLMQLSDNTTAALDSLTRSLRMSPDQPFDATLYNREFELLYQQALDIAIKERHRQSTEKSRAAVDEMNSGRAPEARILLDSALELNPDNPSALYNLALLDLRAGAGPKAMGDFERVVALTYKDTGLAMTRLRAKALTSMGVIYQQQDRPSDAEQSFLEATRADPKEASAWMNLGLLHFRQGHFEAASTVLERAHELLPDHREVTLALAESLVGSGQPGQAATTLKTDLQRRPEDAELWLKLAQIDRGRGETAAAIQALNRSVQADSQNQAGIAVRSAIQLVALHLEQGDQEEALVAANQAVGWARDDPEAWTAQGEAQLAADQAVSAAASLGRAAELDPNSLDRQMALGDVLLANNQLPQAEAAYLRALTLDPNSVEATTNLEATRSRLDNERAIVAGKVRPRKPIAPKKIGLEFAGIDYRNLQLRGALVKQVNKKSPAARAGLRKGDLILWVGDYSVLSDKDFFQFLKRSPPGDTLDLEYLRDGRIFDVEVQLR